MEYTILILLLPLASFLVLGLAGMKMRPAAAGAVCFKRALPHSITMLPFGSVSSR